MEYRTHITFDIGDRDEDAGLVVLRALENGDADLGPVVSQNTTSGTLTVVLALDSPTGQPDVVLGRVMRLLVPVLRVTLGIVEPRVLRADVELVSDRAAAAA